MYGGEEENDCAGAEVAFRGEGEGADLQQTGMSPGGMRGGRDPLVLIDQEDIILLAGLPFFSLMYCIHRLGRIYTWFSPYLQNYINIIQATTTSYARKQHWLAIDCSKQSLSWHSRFNEKIPGKLLIKHGDFRTAGVSNHRGRDRRDGGVRGRPSPDYNEGHDQDKSPPRSSKRRRSSPDRSERRRRKSPSPARSRSRRRRPSSPSTRPERKESRTHPEQSKKKGADPTNSTPCLQCIWPLKNWFDPMDTRCMWNELQVMQVHRIFYDSTSLCLVGEGILAKRIKSDSCSSRM